MCCAIVYIMKYECLCENGMYKHLYKMHQRLYYVLMLTKYKKHLGDVLYYSVCAMGEFCNS